MQTNNNQLLTPRKTPRPICIGTGFIVLDVVVNGNPRTLPKAWAGGSCGNVLTILSYLGWDAYPIAKLGKDNSAERLLNDLSIWKVKTNLIQLDIMSNTPVLVQKIQKKTNGMLFHQFKYNCPYCGERLPKHKSILVQDVKKIFHKLPEARIFYFDRVRRGSFELAKLNKDRGALIFFEPSNMKNKSLLLECLKIADIVKYADDRVHSINEITKELDIPLEIETLGASGLRYRLGTDFSHTRTWHKLPAHPVVNLLDSAGAGDWCSAGIIHRIGQKWSRSDLLNNNEIESAIRFGQALAALNCYYEGARGAMYNLSKHEFDNLVNDIIKGEFVESLTNENKLDIKYDFTGFCHKCQGDLNLST